MSFYHILLSDAAKTRFPDNHAAKFSIPIDDAQQLSGEWEVAIAQLVYSNCLYTFNGEVITIAEKRKSADQTKTKVLSPHIIKSVQDAIDYLNEVINDKRIQFTAIENILSLTVGGKDITLTMDNTLRDILGFDENTFKSGTVVQATAKISLTRRINYFQIYSNIGVNVRVGDTQAPLLSMIPFNPKDCSILSERHFKKLYYVDLKSNYIPQIDISIYDDAGMPIPFHKDAITSLTLHFKRKT